MFVSFSLGFALVILAIGLILMAVFGVRNIASGKYTWGKIGIILSPIALFFILFAVIGDATRAGLVTMLLMVVVLAIIVALLGLRSTFKY